MYDELTRRALDCLSVRSCLPGALVRVGT